MKLVLACQMFYPLYSTVMKPPLERTYWVIADKLLAGLYPGDTDRNTMHYKLNTFLDAGIRTFINLMEEDERDHNGNVFAPYDNDLKHLAAARGLDVAILRYPIRDLGIPTDSVMKSILDTIDDSIERGKPVYVHCWGGRGRTGSVVGCYLARHGMGKGADALALIRKLRSEHAGMYDEAPETKEQNQMVVRWNI